MIGFSLQRASTMAPAVDALFNFVLWTCLASFLLIVFGKVFFLIKFWRKKRPEHLTPYITGHTATELSVAGILLIWVMVIFYWGWIDYKKLRTAPTDSMEIYVTGRQWSWQFRYPEGQTLMNEMVVPKGRPVKLIMTSEDVLHSFFVPDFRVKQDIIPKTYTSLWFEATKTGEFPVFCAEYCGAAHSGMLAKVKVVEPDEYEDWLTSGKLEAQEKAAPSGAEASGNLAEQGKILYNAKACAACHTTDGKVLIGPSFAGIFGHEVELEGGAKAKVDENYIRESLMEPNAKVVKGFQPVMPTMKGQLTDDEINALIAFIKSLAAEGGKK